jgi:AcrR family transcriptional regulator
LTAQPENKTGGRKRPSFIEQARRRQIIAAAIETLATEGWGATSLALIAAHAGISKGVISYHFAGKDQLMEAIVENVYASIGERIVPQLAGLDPMELVAAHVKAVAADLRDHRDELLALSEIITHQLTADGRPRWTIADNEPLYQALEDSYRAGQRAGVFRTFDTRVMAVTVQAALDTMLAYYVAHPDTDLDAYAVELGALIQRAVAK